MIIGLAGRKRSGKTTCADYLVSQGYRRVAFAAPVKTMINLFLMDMGLSGDEIIDYSYDKELVIPAVGCSYRALLQTLGTDWGRNMVHPDVWVAIARRRVSAVLENGGAVGVVVEDIRFENEAEMVRDLGGLVVHLARHSNDADAHVSEAGIEVNKADALINNNGDVQSLIKHINAAISGHHLRVAGHV